MSGYYYRVTPEPERVEGYGFRKVTQLNLVEILERVSKSTYSSRLQRDEPDKVHNYNRVRSSQPPRTPSACRRRLSIGSNSGKMAQSKKYTEQELQRLLRRVRKPTIAYEVSRTVYDPSKSDDSSFGTSPINKNNSRPMTTTERKKAFNQLSRPTMASRAKSVNDCHLCDPTEAESNKNIFVPFEYPYADDQSATREEVANIVSRVSSPTKASEKGVNSCWCSSPCVDPLRHMSERLPLVSGMTRSKSTTQITNRLHLTRGAYRRTRHGFSLQATPISDFYANHKRQNDQHQGTTLRD